MWMNIHLLRGIYYFWLTIFSVTIISLLLMSCQKCSLVSILTVSDWILFYLYSCTHSYKLYFLSIPFFFLVSCFWGPPVMIILLLLLFCFIFFFLIHSWSSWFFVTIFLFFSVFTTIMIVNIKAASLFLFLFCYHRNLLKVEMFDVFFYTVVSISIIPFVRLILFCLPLIHIQSYLHR